MFLLLQNRAAVSLIRIIKKNEQLKSPECNPCEDPSNPVVRYSIILLHVFHVLLGNEGEEEIAADMLHSLELIGLVVGPQFYLQGMPELLSILSTTFQYNVRLLRDLDYQLPSLEEYIDDTSYDILHDDCPVVSNAIILLESIFLHFPEVTHVFPLQTIQQLWEYLKIHLIPETDGFFLSNFFHLASVILEYLQNQALFLVRDLFSLLEVSLQNPNEACRGEACRCLGWFCQVFPNVYSVVSVEYRK